MSGLSCWNPVVLLKSCYPVEILLKIFESCSNPKFCSTLEHVTLDQETSKADLQHLCSIPAAGLQQVCSTLKHKRNLELQGKLPILSFLVIFHDFQVIFYYFQVIFYDPQVIFHHSLIISYDFQVIVDDLEALKAK